MWEAAGTIQRRGNVWLVQNPLPCLPCQNEGCERHLTSFSRCLDELTPAAGAAGRGRGAGIARRRECCDACRRRGGRPARWRSPAKAGMDEGTGAAQGVMLRLPNFTPRMMLILAHDLLAAVAAVVAAFYIRFEVAGLAARWHLLLLLLPGFVVYSAGVFSIFGLYKNKWRFTSLPDLMNIMQGRRRCWR